MVLIGATNETTFYISVQFQERLLNKRSLQHGVISKRKRNESMETLMIHTTAYSSV